MANDKDKEKKEKEKKQTQDEIDWAESVMDSSPRKYKLKDTDPKQKAQPKKEPPKK